MSLVKRLKDDGWRIELVYLALPSVEFSHERVRERKRHGGHGIPEDAIERRFAKSLRNLMNDYAPIIDRTRCLLNHSQEPELIFTQSFLDRQIANTQHYKQLTTLCDNE